MNFFGFGETNQFKQISQKCKEIGRNSTSAFRQKFADLLRLMFPQRRISVCGKLYDDAIKDGTNKWVTKIKSLLSILDPKTDFGSALIANRDQRMDFHQLNLASDYSYLGEDRMSKEVLNLKKQMNALTIPIFESFFLKFLSELVNLKQQQQRGRNWKNEFQTDQFHFHMVRNPILHVLRLWLLYSSNKPLFFNRILNIMEYVLIKQPIQRYIKNQSTLIKTHHFQGIYLLVDWRMSSLVWQFLSFIVKYLPIKQRNFNLLFCAWLRMHQVLLMRGSEYEMKLRGSFENIASVSQKRIDIQNEGIYKFWDKMKTLEMDQEYLYNLSQQIDTLLSQKLWLVTPKFLYAIFSILCMFQKSQYLQKSSLLTEIGTVLQKIISMKQPDQKIETVIKAIVSYYQYLGGVFSSNQNMKEYQVRNNKGMETKSGEVGIKKSFINHQRAINPWQVPIKKSQSHLAYAFTYFVAKNIDRLRGIQSEYPTTNLRYFTSIKAVAILIAIIIIFLIFI